MKLFLDPDDLNWSADRIDHTAAVLGDEHAVQHQKMSDAKSGWVGVSGQALVTLTEQWDLETRVHHRVLHKRAQTYRDTALSFSDFDDHAGGQLNPWKSGG